MMSMSVFVSLSVYVASVCQSIFAELHVQSFTKLFVCACYLWPRLGSSIAALPYVVYFLFMDDVMFAHNGLDVKKIVLLKVTRHSKAGSMRLIL